MRKGNEKSVFSQNCFIIFILIIAVIVSELSDAKFLRAKNKKIHKFFSDDDDDNLFDHPNDDDEDDDRSISSSLSSSSDHQTTDSLITPLLLTTELDVANVVNSSDGAFEQPQNPFAVTSSDKNSSVDLCAGIRCRVGRVCEVDDEFSGAWCVCAGAGHCVDHGRRVCGSDGRFYFSHCEMHRVACVRNRRIRADHNEQSCVRHLLAKGYRQLHDSAVKRLTEEASSLEFTDVTGHPTLSPSATDGATVDKEQGTSLSTPEQTHNQCSVEVFQKRMVKLLQHYCTKTENHDCLENAKRHTDAANSMFRFYDRDSNQLLDQAELDGMESDLAEQEDDEASRKFRDSCRLRDVVKSSDDLALNVSEFLTLLGVAQSLGHEEAPKVFTISTTIGTSLELKCDAVGTTEFAWMCNGHLLNDLGDSKLKVFDDGSLYFSEVFLYHVGNYTCQEKNSNKVIQTHLVSVRVPPIVRVSPKIRFLAPRSSVAINCHVEGIPVPDVSWMANDVPLPDTPEHYSLLHNGLTLQIRDVDYSIDTGTFKCRAENTVGLSEDVATVFIENSDSFQGSYTDELYELFLVFHGDGYTVYEPSHCHMHHVVKGDYSVEPRDVGGAVATLCDSNATCEWGSAVNVKDAFVYVSQPSLNRIVVIEIQDRFNPIEIITVDENPQEIIYVEHLDQIWVSCATDADDVDDGANSLKTLMIIQRASADVRHNVIHTQPFLEQFDKVRSVFLPPPNAFKQTFDYGFVVRGGGFSLHKIDLNTMMYVKELDSALDGDCIINQMTFVPLAGKIFVNCKEATSGTRNTTSCFTVDYVTDKIANATIPCGEFYVSPDSRHLVAVADDRQTVRVHRVEDNGSIDLAYEKEMEFRIGELAFVASERGYDLFANFPDKPDVLYMNLALGHVEIIKGNVGHSSVGDSSGSKVRLTRLPIVSGGVFSDYILTPSTDAVRVIDVKRRHVQCEWQDIETTGVVAWVESSNH